MTGQHPDSVEGVAPQGAAPSPRRRNRIILGAVATAAAVSLGTGLLAWNTTSQNNEASERQAEMFEQLAATTVAGDNSGSAGTVPTSSVLDMASANDAGDAVFLDDSDAPVGADSDDAAFLDGDEADDSSPDSPATQNAAGGNPIVGTGETNDSGISEGTLLGAISIPTINLERTVLHGVRDSEVDSGGFAHHPSSALPGSGEAVMACHRTTYGAPCHDIHQLNAGDPVTYTASDGTVHSYKVVDVSTLTVDEMATKVEGSVANMLSFYACSDANGMPGSTSHRTLVRAIAT